MCETLVYFKQEDKKKKTTYKAKDIRSLLRILQQVRKTDSCSPAVILGIGTWSIHVAASAN